jgi:outer membrane immunogenic protein
MGVVMKKFIGATVALAALIAGPAMAADLSRPAPVYRAPPPLPVYVFSWTGCYIGANVGGIWTNRQFTDRFVGDPFFGQTFNENTSSWLGGVQAGCNYQFAGGWVVGIQADYDWAGHRNNNDVFFTNLTGSFETKHLGSATARIGYAWDRFLGYVKGGAAWERNEFLINFPNGTAASFTRDPWIGWTVGVGGEYAFNDWLTGFIEYDYYGFNNTSDNFVCGFGGCINGAFALDHKEHVNVVKVGLNFLFGGGRRYGY